MFENKYPYTDSHELNLDWFLEEFKKVYNHVDDLDATVKQFTDFVKNYFDNLDVQQEINNKLDAMAADGTLSALIQPLFDEYKTEIDGEISDQNVLLSNMENNIDTLVARMDTFTVLPDLSTAGDAELADIRVGVDGTVYNNAGDAVRGQVTNLTNDFTGLRTRFNPILNYNKENVGTGNNGGVVDTSTGTITIPTGSSGNNSKIGISVKTSNIEAFKGKTLSLQISYGIVGDTIPNPILDFATNVTDVTYTQEYSRKGFISVKFSVPANAATGSGKYIQMGIIKGSGSSVSEDTVITLNSITIQEYYLSDYVEEKEDRLAAYQTKKIALPIDYDDEITHEENGATFSAGIFTIPAGSTGQNSYVRYRFQKNINMLRGKHVRFEISYNCSVSNFKLLASLLVNNTGITLLYSKVDMENSVLIFEAEFSPFFTSTYSIFALVIDNYTTFAENVTLEILSAKAYLLSNNTEQMLNNYRTVHGGLLSAFGHSMVDQKRWQNVVLTETGLASYENTAISGGVLMSNYTSVSNIDPDSDVIVVWYDTNDWSNNVTLGDVSDDPTLPATYCGALNYVCKYISENIPKARTILVSSPQRYDNAFVTVDSLGYMVNNNGDTLEDFANKIKEIADHFGFQYCDLYHKSGCNAHNTLTFLDNDKLHPNYYGAYRMGLLIADCIK